MSKWRHPAKVGVLDSLLGLKTINKPAPQLPPAEKGWHTVYGEAFPPKKLADTCLPPGICINKEEEDIVAKWISWLREQDHVLTFTSIPKGWLYLFDACDRCKGYGHLRGDCPTPFSQSTNLESAKQCSNCTGKGHSQHECFSSVASRNIQQLSFREFLACEKSRLGF